MRRPWRSSSAGAGLIPRSSPRRWTFPERRDLATAEEIDAAREAFREHGVASEWHDTLRAAIRAAAAQTGAGDLIVLIGAQGMNEGKRILLEEG